MIQRWRALPVLLALVLSVPFAHAQAPAKRAADYQVGDIARSNITTHIELVVIDREASAALRQQEAAKIPAVFRLQPDAAEGAILRLREAFALARDTFVLQLAAKFGRRQLEPAQIKSAAFREFRAAFQSGNKGLPVTARLGAAWAGGGDGAAIEQELTAALREAVAGRRIRADEWPEEARNGPTQVRLLPMDAPTTLEPAALERAGSLVNRGTLAPLAKVRAELQKPFAAGDRALARHVAAMIEPDCVFDPTATRALREFKTADLWSADRYTAGQVIVRAGEMVTPRIKAALDELAAQTAVSDLRQQPWRPLNYWPLLLISVSTGLIIAGAFVFFISRRIEPRLDTLIVEAGAGAASLPSPARPVLTAGDGSAASIGADPGVTHEQVEKVLHDKLVSTLLTQRKQMIDVQRQAVSDIADLELRLAKLQAPLQARLDAYEQRIAELEKDLVTRGHENSELINATIALVKEKLETERGHQPPRVKLN
jgi:hypothetical protein